VKLYHVIKKKEILKTLTFLDEFGRKFPLLTLGNVNLGVLAKQGEIKEKDIKVMVVFMDYLKINKAYISVSDIQELKVKKKQQQWRITVVPEGKQKSFMLSHVYTI